MSERNTPLSFVSERYLAVEPRTPEYKRELDEMQRKYFRELSGEDEEPRDEENDRRILLDSLIHGKRLKRKMYKVNGWGYERRNRQ